MKTLLQEAVPAMVVALTRVVAAGAEGSACLAGCCRGVRSGVLPQPRPCNNSGALCLEPPVLSDGPHSALESCAHRALTVPGLRWPRPVYMGIALADFRPPCANSPHSLPFNVPFRPCQASRHTEYLPASPGVKLPGVPSASPAPSFARPLKGPMASSLSCIPAPRVVPDMTLSECN